MIEQVMIPCENRPLFRSSSRENSSHIYSPFPAAAEVPILAACEEEEARASKGRTPVWVVGSRKIWRIELESGRERERDEGRRTKRWDENLNLVSVDRDLRSPLHSIMGCRRPPLATLRWDAFKMMLGVSFKKVHQ